SSSGSMKPENWQRCHTEMTACTPKKGMPGSHAQPLSPPEHSKGIPGDTPLLVGRLQIGITVKTPCSSILPLTDRYNCRPIRGFSPRPYNNHASYRPQCPHSFVRYFRSPSSLSCPLQ